VLQRDARGRRRPAPRGAARRSGAPDKPKLDDAHRILAEQKAKRDALFEQSVESEKTRGDALAKRFEEALKQARDEPVVKPTRGFDLD